MITTRSLMLFFTVAATGVVAAPAPEQLVFNFSPAPPPKVELLSRPTQPAGEFRFVGKDGRTDQSKVPFRAPDLIAPASNRQEMIWTFRAGETPSLRPGATRLVYPLSPTDLIAPASQREKLIQDFKSRAEPESSSKR